MEKKLIAIYPILYRAHQYKVGDELPTQDAEMVKAWLEAHTAEWKGGKESLETAAGAEEGEPEEAEEKTAEVNEGKPKVAESEAEQQEQPKATATPATAVAGMEGQSSTGENGAMIGRVPAIAEREKPKIGRTSIRKAPTKSAAKKK